MGRDRGEAEVGTVLPDPRRVEWAAVAVAPDGRVELGGDILVPIVRGGDGRLHPMPGRQD